MLGKDVKSRERPNVTLAARQVARDYGSLRSRKHPAVADVSLSLSSGSATAIVGESGSGKSTLARLFLRLEQPDEGALFLDDVDINAMDERTFRRRVQMVFQDPYASLDPMRTVGGHLRGPLVRLAGIDDRAWIAHAEALLEEVGLAPAREFLDRRPHELSGGQRQRVAIARALAAGPDVLVADEPTSMLDVSVRVGVLDVFAERKARGLALALITHDLGAAARIADRIAVLFAGRLVEEGPFHEVLRAPRHPYTRSLVDALESLQAPQEPALPEADAEHGCAYIARCPEAEPRCIEQMPPLVVLQTECHHAVRCVRADKAPSGRRDAAEHRVTEHGSPTSSSETSHQARSRT
jgi:peptide/nickel transport system ATP-binding protein